MLRKAKKMKKQKNKKQNSFDEVKFRDHIYQKNMTTFTHFYT